MDKAAGGTPSSGRLNAASAANSVPVNCCASAAEKQIAIDITIKIFFMIVGFVNRVKKGLLKQVNKNAQ